MPYIHMHTYMKIKISQKLIRKLIKKEKWDHRDDSVVTALAAKPEELNLIPRIHWIGITG